MKYPFLLTAGAGCYPSAGAGDWIGCFESPEAAESYIRDFQRQRKEEDRAYEQFDWYKIIDLRDWTDGSQFHDKNVKYTKYD